MAIREVLNDMLRRHGDDGAPALVVALGRHHVSALHVIAKQRGDTVEAVLDSFERHKLEQVVDEDEWGAS